MPLYKVFNIQTKLLEVRIVLGCKTDTNTTAALKMWVLEFGPGFSQRGKDLTKRCKIEGSY